MKNRLTGPVWAIALLFASPLSAQAPAGVALPAAPETSAQIRAKERLLQEKVQAQLAAEHAFEDAKLAVIQSRLLAAGIPKMNNAASDQALQKRAYPGFLVGFSATHGQPQWSFHLIERDIFDICHDREEKFFEDLTLTGAAHLTDYQNSDFQRGHQAPAADFRWSPKASVASNTLSNICPQSADLNTGLWEGLEISARNYLELRRDSLEELMVVTGPVLEAGLKTLHDTSHVSIPKRFFKAVVNRNQEKGIAFLVEAGAPKLDPRKDFKLVETELRKRAMPIDSLEKIVGIDFFPNLTAGQEQNIEGQIDLQDWFATTLNSLVKLPAPVTDTALLKDAFNTVQITSANLKTRNAVVGTVTQVSVSDKGSLTIFLDKLPPKQDFHILIQARDVPKFAANLPEQLKGKVVRAEGAIKADGTRFAMDIRDPNKLRVVGE